MRNSQNEHVPVVIVPADALPVLTKPAEEKIRESVRQRVLSERAEAYQKVQVEVERGGDNRPVALVASLLRANTYTADVVKLTVDPDFNIKSIEAVS